MRKCNDLCCGAAHVNTMPVTDMWMWFHFEPIFHLIVDIIDSIDVTMHVGNIDIFATQPIASQIRQSFMMKRMDWYRCRVIFLGMHLHHFLCGDLNAALQGNIDKNIVASTITRIRE